MSARPGPSGGYHVSGIPTGISKSPGRGLSVHLRQGDEYTLGNRHQSFVADHVRLPARRAGRKIGRRDIDYLNVGFLKGDSHRKIAGGDDNFYEVWPRSRVAAGAAAQRRSHQQHQDYGWESHWRRDTSHDPQRTTLADD
jgi:hypothetical protein